MVAGQEAYCTHTQKALESFRFQIQWQLTTQKRKPEQKEEQKTTSAVFQTADEYYGSAVRSKVILQPKWFFSYAGNFTRGVKILYIVLCVDATE